jgi:hypothetical protein
MAKLDGMDPKLVRQLLGEVRQAAKEMRSVDGRVGQLVSSAGLPRPATHRPAQVADACDGLVHDVTGRLTLLEKQEKQKAHPGDQAAKSPSAKHSESMGEKKPGDHPPADPQHKPTADEKPTNAHAHPKDTGSTASGTPKHGDNPKHDGTKHDGAKHNGTNHAADKPDASKDSSSDGAKHHSASDKSDKPDASKDSGADGSKDGSKNGGKGAGGDTSGHAKDSGGNSIVDTDRKDHAGDIDTTDKKPHVIVVDGVKVVTTSMTPPSEAHLRWLNDHMSEIKPIDMPTVGGHLDTSGAGGPQPDGPAGRIEPSQPSHPIQPVAPLPPDSGGQAVDTGGATTIPGTTTTPDNPFASDDLRIVNHDGITLNPHPAVTHAPSTGTDTSTGIGTDTSTGTGTDMSTGIGTDTSTGIGTDTSTGTGSTGDGSAGAGMGGGAGEAQAVSSGDVVSVSVDPPNDQAVQTITDHYADIGPADMPSVQVPEGELGKGEWAPMEIRPDGPAGEVDPGQPLKPIPPPGS